jgi:hypothetical protein
MTNTDLPMADSADSREALPSSSGGGSPPFAPAGATFDPYLSMIERAARDPTIDLGKLEGLMAMRERVEDRRSKQAFDNAIAVAKGEIGPIVKNRTVDFTNKAGQRTNYKYEDFAGIAAAVDPVLARYGLSYRFRTEQTGTKLRVTCRISHADGYGEDTTLEAINDESGNKNSIQAVGSAATYLQRYTLKLALGLAASNDDDGRLGKDEDEPLIDADQLAQIQEMLAETKSNVGVFFLTIGCVGFSDMTVPQYRKGIALLNEKKRRMALATS